VALLVARLLQGTWISRGKLMATGPVESPLGIVIGDVNDVTTDANLRLTINAVSVVQDDDTPGPSHAMVDQVSERGCPV